MTLDFRSHQPARRFLFLGVLLLMICWSPTDRARASAAGPLPMPTPDLMQIHKTVVVRTVAGAPVESLLGGKSWKFCAHWHIAFLALHGPVLELWAVRDSLVEAGGQYGSQRVVSHRILGCMRNLVVREEFADFRSCCCGEAHSLVSAS